MGNFKIKGIKSLNRKIGSIKNDVGPKAYASSLIKILLSVEAEMIPRTPIATGKLRRSGTGNATITKVGVNGAKGMVFYTANYAVFVHERTELRHNTGEAKFLQNAILAVAPTINSKLASSIKTSIFGGK